MNLFTDIEFWLTQQGRKKPFSRLSISGGSICESWLIQSADNHSYFVKTLANAPTGLFQAEKAGLLAIKASNSLTTPDVYFHTHKFLILEYLPNTKPSANYWELFAEQLAKMHSQSAPAFGFVSDNFCGTTPQPNSVESDAYVFFSQKRLMYQADIAHTAGYLSANQVQSVEKLCERLPHLIPNQPPCLLHGDLWSGNLQVGRYGKPVVIDPACYWGWAEADVAMTLLFGGFPQKFYNAYTDHHPLTPGWEDRIDLYNLYHLLNHLNLFGHSYYPQVINTIKRYQ